jgi:hypothetical protein
VLQKAQTVWQQYQNTLPAYIKAEAAKQPHDPSAWLLGAVFHPLENANYRVSPATINNVNDPVDGDKIQLGLAVTMPHIDRTIPFVAESNYQNNFLRIGFLCHKDEAGRLISDRYLKHLPDIQVEKRPGSDYVFIGAYFDNNLMDDNHQKGRNTQDLVAGCMNQIIPLIDQIYRELTMVRES